MHVKLNR